MKKTDQDFYDFALSESPGTGFTHWIEKMRTEFEAGLRCPQCEGKNIEITVDQNFILWCRDCKKYSDQITLDMITEKDYNAVTFLHEDKVREILTSKQETA